mmetsp:Transcript_13193/g.41744  ORF Transcript_13193/g.41744 Transcript_13193/m.41744 type:complete len:444 (+) Transcript_13193:177-1508(+)
MGPPRSGAPPPPPCILPQVGPADVWELSENRRSGAAFRDFAISPPPKFGFRSREASVLAESRGPLARLAATMAERLRYAFIVDWFDTHACVTWKYQLMYNVGDGTIEMYDLKNRRTFLKRCKYPDVKPENLYLGSIITVYSRQLTITEYADQFTKEQVEKKQKTLAMVKPEAVQHLGKIVNAIVRSGFLISNMKMCQLSRAEAAEFYAVHEGKPFYPTLIDYMTSGRIVAMELVAEDAIQKWRTLLGPTDVEVAKTDAPNSIRAHFGTDKTQNAAHGSDAPETAAAETAFFFGRSVGKCAVLKGSTCCIIKPHAVKAGYAGLIIDRITERFHVTALQMFNLERGDAQEFHEVYKGVIPEYSAMVDELTSGPFIALEVTDPDGEECVEPLRALCGPTDPEIAKVLRGGSLRAMYGSDKVKNAVHCTDLPEDGELEVNYFFNLLA